MKIRPLTGVLGAEISDVDVREPSSFKEIHRAFVKYGVIAIRDQSVTPEEQIRFAQKFGEININKFFTPHPDYPEISLIIKEPQQRMAIGESWHTDHSYDVVPCMASMLHTIEAPEVGGDTGFSSMSSAFGALSESMKNFLRGLSAHHSNDHVFGYTAKKQYETHQDGRVLNSELAVHHVIHPVVIKHPLSGKECLYVNKDFTTHVEELSEAESESLLQFLYRHASDIRFTCRLRHAPGTITIWDNQSTWHTSINDYDGYRRIMHRIVIKGSPIQSSLPR
ncbi:MAG: taurine dioxygenase [Acidiferrobacteraceae bacterium]|nr:taurine dioxygenase [Acidiferrobacteraceae bacterium]